ncbi:LysR family transcriptional regulator [Paraburkholderia sp. SIMBA_049]
MDILQGMTVFLRIVDTSSFSGAAELLAMPRASVSTLMQALESPSRCTAVEPNDTTRTTHR